MDRSELYAKTLHIRNMDYNVFTNGDDQQS
jgi:hypothetical protein